MRGHRRNGEAISGAGGQLAVRVLVAILCGSGLLARAEPPASTDRPGSTPEQPEWSSADPGIENADAPLPFTPREGTEESVPGPDPSVELDIPGRDPGPTAISGENEATATTLDPAPANNADMEPIDADSTVGTPSAGNFYLPDFDTYGRAWFERQGLKFRVGPVHLRMALGTSVEYNDNIYGRNTNVVGDYIGRITPEFLVGLGDFRGKVEDYLLLSYEPSLQSYYEQKERDRTNQNLEITGQAAFSRYSTKVELGYVSNNQPNATQTGGTNYSTLDFAWENRYFLGAKTFAQATVNALIQESDTENNYQTFSLSPQLGYAYSPKTTLFAGPFAGIAYIGEGGTQTFQGVTVGFDYTNLRKLRLLGNVGVQARQFEGLDTTGAQNFITPIFDFRLTYDARADTAITLRLARNVQISDLLRGLTYTNSQLTLGWAQTVYQRVSFNFGLSYQLLEYQGEEPFGRTENFVSVSPSLSYRFWRDTMDVSVYYRRQQRTSDSSQFDYTQNIYGFRLSYRF